MKIKNIKTKKIKSSSGFTIIETLVAIFVLLISTTGPLTFAQSGLRASFQARDQVTAFYLAQDVIEVIKNLRDNNNLASRSGGGTTYWLGNLQECNPAGDKAVCNMETGNSIDMMICSSDGCSNPLRYDQDTATYLLPIITNSSKPFSKYTRTIYINEIVPDKEAQIIVKVSWTSNVFGQKNIVVQENIFKNYE